MKSLLCASIAALALTAAGPLAGAITSASAAENISGQQLTVFGPWLGPDQERVQKVFDEFKAETGVDLRYVGSDSFEQQIMVDAEAGSAPNIAIFPQPGLAADMAKRGFLTPLGDDTAAWLKENYSAGQSWVDLSTYAGPTGKKELYAFPYKVDLKSLVWYNPENFEDMGYKVPKTMEELKALTDKIVADGGTPWCIGLGSGGATGWPATDWVEDMMLRTEPPEVYDGWTTNKVHFDDPRVLQAIDEFGYFAKNDKYVAGGVAAVSSTDFRDSPKGLFSAPPQCYLHRQASFITSFFPEGTVVGQDADFFYMPAYASKDLGQPVLGAGTLWAITKDSPAARALIKFLETPKAHETWMAIGGFLTPYKAVDTSKFIDEPTKKMNDILLNATTFRFDGSDLMPGAVGAGAFWTGMVDYVGGKSSAEVGKQIQAAWDAIKK